MTISVRAPRGLTLPPLQVGSPVARGLYDLFIGKREVELAAAPGEEAVDALCELAVRAILQRPDRGVYVVIDVHDGENEFVGAIAHRIEKAMRYLFGINCVPRVGTTGANLALCDSRGYELPQFAMSTFNLRVSGARMRPRLTDLLLVHPDLSDDFARTHRGLACQTVYAGGMGIPDVPASIPNNSPLEWGQIPTEVLLAGAPS